MFSWCYVNTKSSTPSNLQWCGRRHISLCGIIFLVPFFGLQILAGSTEQCRRSLRHCVLPHLPKGRIWFLPVHEKGLPWFGLCYCFSASSCHVSSTVGPTPSSRGEFLRSRSHWVTRQPLFRAHSRSRRPFNRVRIGRGSHIPFIAWQYYGISGWLYGWETIRWPSMNCEERGTLEAGREPTTSHPTHLTRFTSFANLVPRVPLLLGPRGLISLSPRGPSRRGTLGTRLIFRTSLYGTSRPRLIVSIKHGEWKTFFPTRISNRNFRKIFRKW